MSYNKIIGDFGEKLVKEFLIRRGYEILGNNIKTSFKEIDLIAVKNDKLIFVEVKTRTSLLFGAADEMMSVKKIKNLKIAASIYLNNIQNKYYQEISFDFVAVDIDRLRSRAKIRHFKDII